MMKLTLLALVVLYLYEVDGECIRTGVRCLEYTVQKSYQDYEERLYPSIVWVSASAKASSKSDVSRTLIKSLYAYLRGGNDRDANRCMEFPVAPKNLIPANGRRTGSAINQLANRVVCCFRKQGEKLSMMVPVRTKKVVIEGTNSYTMAVALLPEQSENPPAPTDGNVTVNREPSTVYVVRSFGGKAREDDIWDSHARNLKDSAADDDSLDTSFYYMAVYDSPWKETDRLNEVWMVKKE